MSAMLDQLLRDSGDAARLADLARNDVLAGITAPPVEKDDVVFGEQRRIASDMAYARARDDGSNERARDARGAKAERQMRDAMDWANGRRG